MDTAPAKGTSGGSDTVAWTLNVSTSVLIVFVNKVLLSASRSGHGFTFATTLCAFHFLACAGSIWVAQALKVADRAKVPWQDALVFAVVANVSIASLNLSLLVNSVGFYQMAKLLIIPCVCVMEMAMQKKKLTLPEAASILLVVTGVAFVTVNEVQVNPLGLLIAVVSVVSSGLQQIMCGAMQRKYHLSSHQLLSNTAYIQGVMLLAIGPFVDQAVSRRWILDYTWTLPAARQLLLSCALAVLVNISQFMCLGRFSAVTFQVTGHAKTILVLLASWWVFQEPMTARKLLGMSCAVSGMVAYGLIGTLKQHRARAAAAAASAAALATAEVQLKGPALAGKGSAAGSGRRSVGKQAVEAASVRPAEERKMLLSHPIRLTDDGHSPGIKEEGSSSIAAGVVRRHRARQA